ncbi:hypothetical protein GGI42DRAFT_360924 [Trichoderma sp. SZMC 28013]
MPKNPYRHKPSQDGNLLFAKLPTEIRCKIWCMLLVKREGPVIPVHIPRDTATETFFSMEDDQNITFVLNTILRTCRLFYQDQEDHMVFYKFNEFQFPRSRDCLTYVAAITPSRRNAIRNITLTVEPKAYSPYSTKKKKPGNRLRAIAKLCPNLRVLKHDKFFYCADSLTDWAILVAETLVPIVATLPLLQEVYIRGGVGTRALVECHMTTQSISFTWQTSTASSNYDWLTQSTKFSGRGEKVLTTVWEILSKRKTGVHGQPLEPRRVRQAIATTPILTLGQNRRYQSRVNGVPQNVGSLPIIIPTDYIFGGLATVEDIHFPQKHIVPFLRIDMIWYPWDAIFHSSRLSEASSKRYMRHVLRNFQSKYVSWVYFSGTSKGRRHGNRSPQSKLINCIWGLNWQDKAAKLEILKELYRDRKYRPRRRSWMI